MSDQRNHPRSAGRDGSGQAQDAWSQARRRTEARLTGNASAGSPEDAVDPAPAPVAARSPAAPAAAPAAGSAPGSAPAGLRVCAVGEDLVAGVGDPRTLGWVGRVAARTSREGGPVTTFPLGVPGESTAGLLARWREETARRFGDDPSSSRLVLGLGAHDLGTGISLPRTRLNLANILDEAQARSLPAFVVGPPPTLDAAHNTRVGELSGAFADVCQRRRVVYVDTFTPLVGHEDWLADLDASGGVHPGQAGYGLIAWLVLHGGWHAWLGLPER